ncbi:hypothetical protein LCGC14_0555680 [marine sediment metagenome]|uniref:Uncharacterized protein n=1 Tax=marine sediment metagenome TaxID=412755 RepID=A0A0F9S762_9ZZZZ
MNIQVHSGINPHPTSELSAVRVAQWWAETSPSIAKLTSWMDSKESWVQEPDDEFIFLLGEVVDRLDHPEFVTAIEGELAADVARLFALLCSSRFLRLMDLFERRTPGIASRLVFILGRLGGESKIYSDLFCERLMVVHRFELLEIVFSARRAKAIASAMRVIGGVDS